MPNLGQPEWEHRKAKIRMASESFWPALLGKMIPGVSRALGSKESRGRWNGTLEKWIVWEAGGVAQAHNLHLFSFLSRPPILLRGTHTPSFASAPMRVEDFLHLSFATGAKAGFLLVYTSLRDERTPINENQINK